MNALLLEEWASKRHISSVSSQTGMMFWECFTSVGVFPFEQTVIINRKRPTTHLLWDVSSHWEGQRRSRKSSLTFHIPVSNTAIYRSLPVQYSWCLVPVLIQMSASVLKLPRYLIPLKSVAKSFWMGKLFLYMIIILISSELDPMRLFESSNWDPKNYFAPANES